MRGGKKWYGNPPEVDDFVQRIRVPEITVDEATPDDVRKRAKSESERLKGEIQSLNERIAKAKADLKFWEGVQD